MEGEPEEAAGERGSSGQEECTGDGTTERKERLLARHVCIQPKRLLCCFIMAVVVVVVVAVEQGIRCVVTVTICVGVGEVVKQT